MRNRSGVERYGGKPIVAAEPTRRPTCWVVSEIPWFYVDDGFSDSKPVLNMPSRYGLSACGLWVLAGSWSAKEETDGFVPDVQLHKLGAKPQIVAALTDSGPLSAPLCTQVDGGMQFNSWSKWQKTRAELQEKRKADAERQQKSRAAKRKGRNAVSSTGDGMSQCDAEDSANVSVDADGEMSRCDSHVTSRARAQTRPDPTLSSYLGGECPVGEPDGLPPRFCEEHPDGTTRGCGACRDARLRREAAEADLARDELDAKRRQRDAATNCPICQGTNWIPDTEPAVRCNHA